MYYVSAKVEDRVYKIRDTEDGGDEVMDVTEIAEYLKKGYNIDGARLIDGGKSIEVKVRIYDNDLPAEDENSFDNGNGDFEGDDFAYDDYEDEEEAYEEDGLDPEDSIGNFVSDYEEGVEEEYYPDGEDYAEEDEEEEYDDECEDYDSDEYFD